MSLFSCFSQKHTEIELFRHNTRTATTTYTYTMNMHTYNLTCILLYTSLWYKNSLRISFWKILQVSSKYIVQHYCVLSYLFYKRFSATSCYSISQHFICCKRKKLLVTLLFFFKKCFSLREAEY